MSDDSRRPLKPEEEGEVRCLIEALLRGSEPARAARELYSVGVRTRGAMRTRGSVRAAAPPRLPAGADLDALLGLLRHQDARLRSAVASALAEWGGGERAIDALRGLAIGDTRDNDAAVRAAALDAIGIIGGPKAEEVLEQAAKGEEDSAVGYMAWSLLGSIRRG